MSSQTLVLNEKGDTTICFSISQSKFLLKEHYKRQECDTLRTICETQLTFCDSVIVQKDRKINDYSRVLNNKDDEVYIKDNQIVGLKNEVIGLNKAVRRQKVYKWISMIGGGALTGFLGYEYIKKP